MRRNSITSYGGNIDGISAFSGFEQVVTNGIATYYVLNDNHVIQFDQYWNYEKNNQLPYRGRKFKYVNEYFYISGSADESDVFYKTDMNFNLIAYFDASSFNDEDKHINYNSIYHDSKSLLFYVSGDSEGVSVFDANCNFQRYIMLVIIVHYIN